MKPPGNVAWIPEPRRPDREEVVLELVAVVEALLDNEEADHWLRARAAVALARAGADGGRP